jgi:hypothetical protein
MLMHVGFVNLNDFIFDRITVVEAIRLYKCLQDGRGVDPVIMKLNPR